MGLTALQCSSSGASKRLKVLLVHSLPSLQMGRLLHGAILHLAVTALQSNIGSGMYSSFKPHVMRLLPSLPMDPL
jgi:hypothetical protein